MIHRFLWFSVSLLVGAVVGWWSAGSAGLLPGVVVGTLAWWGADAVAISRLEAWLRTQHEVDDADSASGQSMSRLESLPPESGLWGETADRMRRLLRDRERLHLESQSRLDEFLSALQASPNGVVLLDPEGRIEWCNLTAAQHFGFDAQRDVMQYVANLVREPAFTAYLAARDFSVGVVIPGGFKGSSSQLKLAVQAHPYGKNRKLLLSRDITAIEMAEAMRRDFVANVSHEIRTPLTVLSGFIETLQTLPLEEPDRERYLELMAQQSRRMQSLVSDLLTLSRLEGSPFPGNNEWVDVRSLLMQCVQDAEAISALLMPEGSDSKPHHMESRVVDESQLAGIHSELHSAMSNLVNNAVRYTPMGGHVLVTWRLLGDGRGEFAVKDSGPGIAAEHIPRLTERFYRVDRSRSRETGGTGLGLAIVKHVAQRHGAELQIESSPGQGSRFVIVFPASRVRRLQPALLAA